MAEVQNHVTNEKSLKNARAYLTEKGVDVLAESRGGFSLRMRHDLAERLLGSQVKRKHFSEDGYWSDRWRFFTSSSVDRLKSPLPGFRDLVLVQPHLFYASSIPPPVPFHHLRLADLPLLTGAATLHRRGITGRDVRIVLIDSGVWLGHAYFRHSRYNVSAEAAADCVDDPTSDRIGHGTAILANLLAIAPDAEVHAIKAGANLNCAVRQAVALSPDILCLPAGYDLYPYRAEACVPRFVKPLEIEIAYAASNGTIVVAPVGNGHLAFPGMHPDVISVGGVYVDRSAKPVVSDYCSVYQAPWYDNRQCPDLCALSGLHPAAAYIMSPVPTGSQIDRDAWDLTGPTDGWSVIGGSSLSAAHVAGGCALALQLAGTLNVADLRNLLVQHSTLVSAGERNIVHMPDTIPTGTDRIPSIALMNLTDFGNA